MPRAKKPPAPEPAVQTVADFARRHHLSVPDRERPGHEEKLIALSRRSKKQVFWAPKDQWARVRAFFTPLLRKHFKVPDGD
jgi:hypothetical protein